MKTRTKIFGALWTASIISTVLILPYVFSIQHEVLANAPISLPILVLISVLQGAVIFGIATYFGLIMAEKTGFHLPLLTAWMEHKKIDYKKIFWTSVIIGLAVGTIIFFTDKFIFPQSVLSAIHIQPWQGFLASFYGGISEEIIMRLFLLSLLVFIYMKIFRKKEKSPFAVWILIIVVSVVFGLGHLPITSAVTAITPMVVLRAIILNGIGGVAFGWLYWKKGLEAAIIAHFFADIVLHVIASY